MKKLYAVLISLCGLILFPCITSYAEVSPFAIIADTTIPEALLVDQDGVKITVTGLSAEADLFSEVHLLFRVQNTRNEDITISSESLSINTFEISESAYFKVPKKSTVDCVLDIDTDKLEINNIERIITASLVFYAYNAEYETVFEAPECTIVTSAYGQYTQQYSDSGTILYDSNNIRIIVRPTIVEGYSGQDIMLYVENNSPFNITVIAGNISVNGKDIEGEIRTYVGPWKKETNELTIEWRDLAKNGIMKITKLEMDMPITSLDSAFLDMNEGFYVDFLTDLKVTFQ